MPFKVGEGVDDVPCLEGPVSLPDVDLRKYPGRHEPSDRLVGLREAASDQFCGAAHRNDRRAGQRPEQKVGRGLAPDLTEVRAPSALDLLDLVLEGGRVLRSAHACPGECADPPIEAGSRGFPGRGALVSGRGERVDVVSGPCRQNERDRWLHSGGQSAATQNQVNESSAGPPVAVRERMDGFELRVRERCLCDGGEGIRVAERAQIVDETGHKLRWRRHEGRRAGVVLAAADPVLPVPELARVRRVPRAGHEAIMEVEHGLRRDRIPWSDLADRGVHGVDVAQNLGGGQVDRSFAELPRCLGPQQLARADLEALDAGRGHRLGAEQEAGQPFGVRQGGCPGVQPGKRRLGVRDIRGDIAIERDLTV